MIDFQYSKLSFHTDQVLSQEQSKWIRGALGRMFHEHDLTHNHDLSSGKCQYRYPLVQYKVFDNEPFILGIGAQAQEILQSMYCQVHSFLLQRHRIQIQKSSLQVGQEQLGVDGQIHEYHFYAPWLALNSNNYNKYLQADQQGRYELLSRCLIGNILSLAKAFHYWVPKRIEVSHVLTSEMVKFKGQKMLGFRGNFRCNLYLPSFIGLGKGCSHGFGCSVQSSELLKERSQVKLGG